MNCLVLYVVDAAYSVIKLLRSIGADSGDSAISKPGVQSLRFPSAHTRPPMLEKKQKNTSSVSTLSSSSIYLYLIIYIIYISNSPLTKTIK